MKPIHIAIASTTSKPGAVDTNLLQIAGFAEQAGRDGADLLLTPELSACGYGAYPEVLATAERAGDGPIFKALRRMAQANRLVVAAGFVEACGDKKFLAHYIVFPDGGFVVQRKKRVTPSEQPLDSAEVGETREPQLSFFEINGVRCVVAICADSGIEGLDDLLAKQGINLLLVPTGAGGSRDDRVTTEELRTDAGRQKYLHWLERVFFPGKSVIDCIRHRRALAAVNLCGDDGQRHSHLGHGMVITPMGEVAAFFHGLPNLDRQRPMYAHAVVDLEDCVL